jgi:hypothetical protein
MDDSWKEKRTGALRSGTGKYCAVGYCSLARQELVALKDKISHALMFFNLHNQP